MDIKCNKCNRSYIDMFDTVIRCDYAEPGKGKSYEWHLCIDCRKKMINWIENDGS